MKFSVVLLVVVLALLACTTVLGQSGRGPVRRRAAAHVHATEPISHAMPCHAMLDRFRSLVLAAVEGGGRGGRYAAMRCDALHCTVCAGPAAPPGRVPVRCSRVAHTHTHTIDLSSFPFCSPSRPGQQGAGRDQVEAGVKHTQATLKSLEELNLGADPVSAKKIAKLNGTNTHPSKKTDRQTGDEIFVARTTGSAPRWETAKRLECARRSSQSSPLQCDCSPTADRKQTATASRSGVSNVRSVADRWELRGRVGLGGLSVAALRCAATASSLLAACRNGFCDAGSFRRFPRHTSSFATPTGIA